jgi:hypothetical protein
MTFDPSNVSHIVIDSPDYAGKKLIIYNSERVETGAGLLKAPIMPIPVQLLTQFGSPATIYQRNPNAYDTTTGTVTPSLEPDFTLMIYAEAYTTKESESIPGVRQGDVKVYAPGQSLGMTTTALLLLSCREEGL